MTSPTPGSTFTSTTVAFQWQDVGATRYHLYIGTTGVGSSNLYSNGTTNTSQTVNNLPNDGSTIYVRLYSQLDGSWHWNDYEYTASSATSTELPLLIVRIEFNDYSFDSSASVWSSKIFGNSEGELNHYYNEISYSKFQFVKAHETQGTIDDGVITVRLNENHPGNSNVEFLSRINDAIAIADTSIDFSTYDRNSDGAISKDELQLMYLVAGGESATGAAPGVWAHAWCMYGGNATPPTHDSVELMSCANNGGYSRFGEKHFNASTGNDATIGIIAHELGHAALNLPDLYDTNGGSEGIGKFGLMGSGNWTTKAGDSYAGETPVHMTGWSKTQVNFTSATVINTTQNSLNVKGTSYSDYQLYKIATGVTGEYFLIENRANSGYDRGLASLNGSYTGGLSILHIDDNQGSNQDENHKLVDVEEANDAGLDSEVHRGHANNLFFSGNSDAFTPTTTPNSNRYDGATSGVNVENISAVGATMTVDIDI
jgi:M6 family metalloprotease-like protein